MGLEQLSDGKRKSVKYGDSSQLTNWILDSGATCHMKPEVSDFIPGSLEYMDKYIEVADRYHVTAKQKGQVRIQMCDNNGKTFIATLYNVLLASDLCDRLFSIITLMNAEHTCIFHKGFCTVYFGAEKKNAVTLPHSAQRKHAFVGKIKDMSKKQITSKKENCFRITTSEIRKQIHQIIVLWEDCKCLGRCRDENISRPFLHFMSNFFNE